MSGWSRDKTAERFDELYTQMTGLQRRLIETVRSGDESDPRTRELEEARTVIAACDTAARAMTLGYSAREVEDRARRARVLNPPLDPALIMAAARSQSRPYGYRLLADALSLTSGANAGEDTNDGAVAANVWAERSVLDVLAAPRAMGEYTARSVAEPIGVVADTMLAELDEPTRARLIAGLRECQHAASGDRSGRNDRGARLDHGRPTRCAHGVPRRATPDAGASPLGTAVAPGTMPESYPRRHADPATTRWCWRPSTAAAHGRRHPVRLPPAGRRVAAVLGADVLGSAEVVQGVLKAPADWAAPPTAMPPPRCAHSRTIPRASGASGAR